MPLSVADGRLPPGTTTSVCIQQLGSANFITNSEVRHFWGVKPPWPTSTTAARVRNPAGDAAQNPCGESVLWPRRAGGGVPGWCRRGRAHPPGPELGELNTLAAAHGYPVPGRVGAGHSVRALAQRRRPLDPGRRDRHPQPRPAGTALVIDVPTTVGRSPCENGSTLKWPVRGDRDRLRGPFLERVRHATLTLTPCAGVDVAGRAREGPTPGVRCSDLVQDV